MIAGGHHISAGVKQFIGDLFVNAKTTRGVLAIDDDKIEIVTLSQCG